MAAVSFDSLLAVAIRNKGSAAAVRALLPQVKTPRQLRATGDDRYLAEMARSVFRAGFSWKVVDKKWPGFEQAFAGFAPLGVAHYSDERLSELLGNSAIIRHLKKITAVRDNAAYLLDVARHHGSFGEFVAAWPESDIVSLWLELKKKGSRLGGNTGPMFLRMVGKDTFILSADVTAALINHRFMDSISPQSRRDLTAVQQVFNDLQQQSGYPLSHISRVLALTVT